MIKPLTSLRFFFAIMVFTSHISFVKTEWGLYNWLQRNIFFEGYLGVSFFFILSGFVLSYSYKEKLLNKKISLRHFYLARLARIYPLHLLTLFLIIPYIIYTKSFVWIKFFPNLLLLQSFIPTQSFFYSFNEPSWSISNEMFFYLLFPFYILTLEKYKFLKIFLFVFFGFLLLILITKTPIYLHKTIFYVNPFIRSLDFILGIILFYFFKSEKIKHYFRKKSIASLLEIFAILIFLIFLIFHNFIDRGYRFSIYYWLPMCIIIISFAHQNGIISKILSHKFFVILGEISFGFYMFHFIIIQYALELKTKLFFYINDLVIVFIIFIITLIISYFSFEWYEKPINKFIKKKFTK